MKKLILFLLLTLPLTFAFTPVPTATTTCNAPGNVQVVSSTTNSVTYGWDAVYGASGYQVYYTREEDSYTSSTYSTTSTSYTFSNLSPGTYNLFVATDCETVISGFLVIEDHIVG